MKIIRSDFFAQWPSELLAHAKAYHYSERLAKKYRAPHALRGLYRELMRQFAKAAVDAARREKKVRAAA